jgi:hypothetical protein
MNIVLRFDEAGSDEKSLVDGKAINLGRPGFRCRWGSP